MKLRVTIDGEVFDVEVGDLTARPIVATVAGQTFAVWPEEAQPAAVVPQQAQPALPALPAAQPPVRSAGQSNAVLAPIPGVILSIHVQPGDTVETGQEVCVLEAMKMKNSIRASRAGTVAAVLAAPGEQVRHGQPLIQFTD